MSVGPSVRPSVTFLNCERFSHYSSCPTVRDCIAVYPALFYFYSFIITVGSIIYDSILQIARFQSVHSNHPMGFTFFSYKNRISTERWDSLIFRGSCLHFVFTMDQVPHSDCLNLTPSCQHLSKAASEWSIDNRGTVWTKMVHGDSDLPLIQSHSWFRDHRSSCLRRWPITKQGWVHSYPGRMWVGMGSDRKDH